MRTYATGPSGVSSSASSGSPSVARQTVKLLGVEAGGIWVEDQQITNDLLKNLGMATAPNTLVLFWPYHEIGFAIGSYGSPSLNERAFGV